MSDGAVPNKRKSSPTSSTQAGNKNGPPTKKTKMAKGKHHHQWRHAVPNGGTHDSSVRPGDAGIWVTCAMSRERRVVGELGDLLCEHAEQLYGDALNIQPAAAEDEDVKQQQQPSDIMTPTISSSPPAAKVEDQTAEVEEDDDIESAIASELTALQSTSTSHHAAAQSPARRFFTNVRCDLQCVLFFRTQPPIDPVHITHTICSSAFASASSPNARVRPRTRFTHRLTPVSDSSNATQAGLTSLATRVLAPHFHGDSPSKKFAIRPHLRNHGAILSRDSIIKTVADIIGPRHKVDLGQPDAVVLVDVFKNVCGMSVVPGDYERKLKRYNLSELWPAPSSSSTGAEAGGGDGIGSGGASSTETT